jgi:hypothetical protein
MPPLKSFVAVVVDLVASLPFPHSANSSKSALIPIPDVAWSTRTSFGSVMSTILDRSFVTLFRPVAALRLLGIILLVYTLNLGSRSLPAQSEQASVAGIVTDAQGAVLPDATVTARDVATGVVTSHKTNNAGEYSITNLPIGEYVVTVEHDGFSRRIQEHVVLSTGQVFGLNAKLQPGAVTETVEVSDRQAELETRTSEIGQTIEATSVSELPLGNRTSMNIISLSGGTVFISSTAYSLAGGRTQSSMTWLDGGSGQNIRLGVGNSEISPPVDTVQELGVISNNYAAEFGGSSGGIVTQTTKSGTNLFHGTLYEFLRNDAFDAPGYFAPATNGAKTKPELRYNIYGGTVGGPIRRDKTFFFFGFEGSRQRTGSTVILTVPTLLERQGNFSQTSVKIYDPKTTRVVNGVAVRDQFPGNVITNFDAVAAKLIQYFPLPTNSQSANNFVKNDVDTNNTAFYIARVDHVLSSRDRLAFRYIFTNGQIGNNSVYPIKGADPYQPNVSNDNIGYGQWIHTLSPSIVNDLRFTFETRVYHQFSDGLGGDWPSQLGITGVSPNAFPNFAPAGYSALGSTGQERRQYPVNQYQLVDDSSWDVGRHTLKFGVELRRSMDHESNLSTASGAFTFGTQATGLPGSNNTGDGFASLLTGFPTAFSEAQTFATTRTSWYIAGFAQDDFAVNPYLTLNFGLRWETDTPIKDENNKMNGFDPNLINPVSGTPGVVKFMGVNGFRTTPYDLDLNNFGPRLGFAWQPFKNGTTVVRGGFGYFFSHAFDAGQPASAALGFSIAGALNSPDNGVTAPFYMQNGVPNVNFSGAGLNDSYGAVKVGATATTTVSYFDPRHRTGYTQQFNLGVQRQLPGSFALTVTGLANIAHKLPGANQAIDQIAPSVLSAAHHSQSDRPFPQFSGVTLVAPSIGNSNYFAGLVHIEKRFSRGFNINSSYTFSKLLDDSEGAGATLGTDNGSYSNYYNRAADYGPSSNDIRHQFVFSSVYELPFGPGRTHLGKGIASHVIGGWTIGNVTRLYSGAPFTVITQTNSTAAFSSGSQRANLVADPALPSGQRGPAKWFNTSAFVQPANYQFGNEGRNVGRGPGFANFDFSLIRSARFTESTSLQIRGEFLNAFNRTNLKEPQTALGATNFGSITSANAARQIQVGARLVF